MPIDIDVSHYNTGTATVAAGGTAVTGQGTTWLGAVRPGDLFGTHVGDGIRILTVDSNTSLTLAYPWVGPAQTAAAYEIQRTPYDLGYQHAVEELLQTIADGNLPALNALPGEADTLPYFVGPGTMALADFPGWARSMFGLTGAANQLFIFDSSGTVTTIPRSDLVSGANYDVQVQDLAGRSAYDTQAEGFSVLVSDTGDGRAAIYSKLSNDSGDWSTPAYVTGPSPTLGIGDVTPTPFGSDPDVTLDSVPGGYEINFGLPVAATFQPGTITTLDPGEEATFDLVPVAGGYELNLGVPRGPTGDIDGVTAFWQNRITVDADADAARQGLEVVSYAEQDLTPAQRHQALVNLGATGFDPIQSERDFVLARPWHTEDTPNGTWIGLAYSPELDVSVAVAASGSFSVMYRRGSGNWVGGTAPATYTRVEWFPAIGRFVAVGPNVAAYSSDGVNWTAATTVPPGPWTSVAYSDKLGAMYAVSRGNSSSATNAGQAMKSEDGGSTWVIVPLPQNLDWLDIIWADELERFIVTGSPWIDSVTVQNYVLTSEDGSAWATHTLPNNGHWWHVIWAKEVNKLVAVANNYSDASVYVDINSIMTSVDGGETWITHESSSAENWYDIAWSPRLGMFVTVANNGTSTARVQYSYDGESWFAWNPPTGASSAQGWRKVIWIDAYDQFLAVATNGTQRSMTTAPLSDAETPSHKRGRLVMGDDSATAIRIDSDIAMVAFSCLGNPGSTLFPSFIVQFRGNASVAPALLTTVGVSNISATTGTLSGTTGTDGNLTLSSNGDGFLYIENRLGNTRTFEWAVLVP